MPEPEVAMASLFVEFSATYDKFRKQFPNHPLTEELKARISKGGFPKEEWMRSKIKKMNDLMSPFWLRSDSRKTSTG